MLFCVLLPAASNLGESAWRMCSDMFFDPYPTLLHAILAWSVPIINAIVYVKTRFASKTSRPWLRLLAGISLGSSLYFTIMFAPLMPFAVPAVAILGIGLLVFGPLGGGIGAVICLRRISQRSEPLRLPDSRQWLRPRPALFGLLIAMVAVASGNVRHAYTLHHLAVAVESPNPAAKATAVDNLRRWGHERTMLEASAEVRRRNGLLPGGWSLLTTHQDLPPAECGQVYYRVTGRSKTDRAVDEPFVGWRGRPRNLSWSWGDLEADEALRGGDVVGYEDGLALAGSSMVGTIHGDAATSYLEWTLEFNNQTLTEKEARCRIALPPEGVVSRVTLWIAGKECEAAYGGAAQVREAYQSVAVVRRRDPLLVTSSGPEHVMLQCFPVPALGRMKAKIGITAPLRLTTASQARFALPCIVERNFAVEDSNGGGAHLVSLDAGLPITLISPAGELPSDAMRAETTTSDDGKAWHLLSGRIPDHILSTRSLMFEASRRPEKVVAWGPDPFADDGRVVVQTLQSRTLPPQSAARLVVDASVHLAPLQEELANAVAALPVGRVDCYFAGDVVATQTGLTPAQAADAVRRQAFVGGQDAVPALLAAKTSTEAGGPIIWIHGPQPILLAPPDPLLSSPPGVLDNQILEVNAVPGQNRVTEALAKQGGLVTVAWEGSLRQTMNMLADRNLRGTPLLVASRAHASEPPTSPDAARSNIDLARLWARDQISLKLAADAGPTDDAVATAVQYRLVTPVSGAVVLETQAQYAEHGLSPVSVVPLPPALWAILLTLPLIVLARRRYLRQAR